MKDAFGDKIEDMSEVSGLVSSTGKIFNNGGEMFDHGVIVGGVVTGDTEDLELDISYNLI